MRWYSPAVAPSPDSGPSLSMESAKGRTLMDPRSDEELRERGVTVVPFLAPDEVADLSGRYWELAPQEDHGLTIDHMRPDRELVRRLRDLAVGTIAPRLDEICVHQRIVMATFVVKHPGPASEMFLHDDRTYVDERVHRASTLWMPLCDVGPDLPNGGLQVVPDSHRLPTGWSGSRTPDLLRPWEVPLQRALVGVAASAGSAVVYDTRLLHASPPNYGEQPRVAVVFAVAPTEAQLLHVIATGRRHRVLHAVDESFFVEHHPRDVERSMPRGWPIVEQLEDASAVRGVDVEAVTGSAPGAPRVVVPSDLSSFADAEGPLEFPTVATSPPSHHRDLRIDLGALHTDHGAVPVLAIEGGRGARGVATLVRGFRRRGQPPHGTQRWRGLLSSGPARDVELHVLEPGARVEVRAPRTPRWQTELVAVEAPTVGAGVLGEDGAAPLDLGTAVHVPQDRRLVVWNDGPGQLIVLAARIPDLADRLGRILQRAYRKR